jgi:hypothetical protein
LHADHPLRWPTFARRSTRRITAGEVDLHHMERLRPAFASLQNLRLERQVAELVAVKVARHLLDREIVKMRVVLGRERAAFDLPRSHVGESAQGKRLDGRVLARAGRRVSVERPACHAAGQRSGLRVSGLGEYRLTFSCILCLQEDGCHHRVPGFLDRA